MGLDVSGMLPPTGGPVGAGQNPDEPLNHAGMRLSQGCTGMLFPMEYILEGTRRFLRLLTQDSLGSLGNKLREGRGLAKVAQLREGIPGI